MNTNLDELCPTLKKRSVAACMNTIYARKYYLKHNKTVRVQKLLFEIAKRGRCVNVSTIGRLDVTRNQIVIAWLKFREQHEPVGKKQLKMQHLVASWM